MRFGFTVLFLLAASSAAQASSFAVLPERTDVASPSIVVLGGPATSFVMASIETVPVASSPSIIALGEPAVAYEHVAAINPEPEPATFNAAQLPMVIRGGITGEAFPDATPVAAAPEPVNSPASEDPEDSPPPPPAVSDTAVKPEQVVDPEAAANLITTE